MQVILRASFGYVLAYQALAKENSWVQIWMLEILRATFGYVLAYQILAKETLAIFNQETKSLSCNAHNIK